jgi:hypothetical protein
MLFGSHGIAGQRPEQIRAGERAGAGHHGLQGAGVHLHVWRQRLQQHDRAGGFAVRKLSGDSRKFGAVAGVSPAVADWRPGEFRAAPESAGTPGPLQQQEIARGAGQRGNAGAARIYFRTPTSRISGRRRSWVDCRMPDGQAKWQTRSSRHSTRPRSSRRSCRSRETTSFPRELRRGPSR